VGDRSISERSGVVSTDENINLSTTHLQDLLYNVIRSLKAEISTVTENLDSENSKLAESITSNLTAKFK
jgi:hypothetical protein